MNRLPGRGSTHIVKALYYKHRSPDTDVLKERYYIMDTFWGRDDRGKRIQWVQWRNVDNDKSDDWGIMSHRRFSYYFKLV